MLAGSASFAGFQYMLTKRYSVPVALFDQIRITIVGSNKRIPSLRLSKLDMRNGVLSWEMRSNDGHVFVGNATAAVELPFFDGGKNCWVKPALPIVLHVRQGICVIELVFCIPASGKISVERMNNAIQE